MEVGRERILRTTLSVRSRRDAAVRLKCCAGSIPAASTFSDIAQTVGVTRRAQAPEARLLAVFEVFDEWFHSLDYEGCLFTNVLIETHDRRSRIRMTCVAQLGTIKDLLQIYAAEAGVRDPETFAAQMQILMWGSIVAAVDGRLDAAPQARMLAELLLERERGDSA
jgi:hypothetical protein